MSELIEQSNNLPVNYEERLAQMAREAQQAERPQVGAIGLKAGQLSYGGNPIAGNALDCIIIASTHANLYYTAAYDPDEVTNPECYAYSPNGEDMYPHPSAPNPQHTDCATCPHNQWKSGAKGKGKACKNVRKLALIPVVSTPQEVEAAEVAVLKVPVMSVSNWANYVDKCGALYQRPPLGMVTQISTTPDPKSQFKVTFKALDKVDGALLGPIFAREESARRALERVYEANPDAPPADEGKKKKF